MYRRDYVLRLIERLGMALIALRNRLLQRKGDQPLAMAELGDIAREAGLDLDVARQLDPAMLLMWLSPTGELDPARDWLLAELLYLSGLQSESANPSSGSGDFRRALALFSRIPPEWHPPGELAAAGERIAELRERLAE